MPQSGSTTPKTKRQGVLSNRRKRWDKEGEDTVHLTRKILANSELRFKDFIQRLVGALQKGNALQTLQQPTEKGRILQGENVS